MTFPQIHLWKLLATILAILAPVWGSVGPFGLPLTPIGTTPTSPATTPALTPAATPVAPAPPTTPPATASTKPTAPPTNPTGQARVIVSFLATDQASRLQVLSEAAASAGLTNPRIVRELATGALLVHAQGETTAYLAALRAHSGVVGASPNSTITRAATANDQYFSNQWALQPTGSGVGFSTVWDRTVGAGARVAVIDSGKTNHPDLASAWLGGHDFVSDASAAGDGNGRDGDATDNGDFCTDPNEPSSWHGTHVAGIIAATRNNSIGIAGAAPNAKVVPVRVLARCGGEMADLIDAIVWSAGGKVPGMAPNPYPARVINMSLSAQDELCSRDLQMALSMARRLGAVSVVAAGNYSHDSRQDAPGNCSGVLTVAASTNSRTRSSFSNFGPGVNLAAPGGEGGSGTGIISTWLNNPGAHSNSGYGYGWMAGTSMAAPYVAATAALMLSLKPNLTVVQIEQILTGTARSSSGCPQCGSGILDAAAAIAAVPTLTSATLAGRQVSLRGSGFTQVNAVWVANQTLTFTRQGDGTITATIPASVPAGRHAVWVQTGNVNSGSVVITLA